MGWAGPSCLSGQLSLTVEPCEFLPQSRCACHAGWQVSPSQLLLLLSSEQSGQSDGQRGNSPPWLPPGTRRLGVVGQIVAIIFIYCCCAREQQSTEPRDCAPLTPPPPSPPAALPYSKQTLCSTVVVVVVVPVLAHTLVTCHLSPVSCVLSLFPLSLPSHHPPACRSPSPREELSSQ